MMKKKLVFFMAAVAVTAVLAACGEGKETVQEVTQAPTITQAPTATSTPAATSTPTPTDTPTPTPLPAPLQGCDISEDLQKELKRLELRNFDCNKTEILVTTKEEADRELFRAFCEEPDAICIKYANADCMRTPAEYKDLFDEILSINVLDRSSFIYNDCIYVTYYNTNIAKNPAVKYFIRTGDDSFMNEDDHYIMGRIIEISEELKLKGMSDFDMAKTVHDYIVLNTTYDYHGAYGGELCNDQEKTYGTDSHTILCCLKNGYSVCDGYAATFDLLMNYNGVECVTITGIAGGGHEWNQVKIDGNWYNFDATWDDENFLVDGYSHGIEMPGNVGYDYFLKSDENFDKDRMLDVTSSRYVHECTDSKYDFWFRDSHYAKDSDSLVNIITEQLELPKMTIVYKSGEMDKQKVIDTIKQIKKVKYIYAGDYEGTDGYNYIICYNNYQFFGVELPND